MKTLLSFLCFLAILTTAVAQNKPIIIGSTETLHSTILKENRTIWIHIPKTNGKSFGAQRFPVIYLLDGDMNFQCVEAILDQMSGAETGTGFPPAILVGIVNTNRIRDLTPTHVTSGPMMNPPTARYSGGGEDFLSFMEKELIPHMDSLYPTAPYKVLIGHSLGGLMAVHALINHPGLFNAAIAIDPSLFWNGQKLLGQIKSGAAITTPLYLAIANTMSPGMDTTKVKEDTSMLTLHVRSNLEFARYLSRHPANANIFNWKYYPEYDHNAVQLVSEFDGLRSVFSFYPLGYPHDAFNDPAAIELDAYLSSHYIEISKHMGYKVNPPELFINDIARNLVNSKQFDRAAAYLLFNAENYPDSFNANNTLGDFYNTKNNKQGALDYYKKALAIRDDAAVREKIGKLNLQ